MSEERPNWRYLGNGFYLVRTQAGFKQAAHHFLNERDPKLVSDVQGYPRSYPAVCVFSLTYQGYHALDANVLHVNSLMKEIANE